MTKTPTEPTVIESADVKWATFMAQLQAAEEQFVRRQPAAFKALWSNAEDISICGAARISRKGPAPGRRSAWCGEVISPTSSRRNGFDIAQRTSPNALRFRCAYPWPFDWRRT